jgi:TetR/AcrR family transcriptional regulator, cholesterol catabolism regulator
MGARIPNDCSDFEWPFGTLPVVPPTRPALRERYDRRHDEVVATAAALFAERGFHATSMADLVAATGLTAGGLYHYIGSKDQLLVRICEQLMEPLLERVEAIVAGEEVAPEEQLRAIVREWTAHVEAYRQHMRVFTQERHVLERGAQWREVRRQRKAFEELLAGVLSRVPLRSADPDLALRALLGMVNHTAQWFRPRGRLTARQVADGYVDLILG